MTAPLINTSDASHANPPALCVPIIGIHRSPLSAKFGAPRQPNLVALTSHITMLAPYDTLDAFMGIDSYSHLWLVWQFHHNKAQAHFRPQVRPPRLGGNDKIGVFATRSMYRPSGLGLSVVRLLDISADANGRGVVVRIQGADLIDGTPIVDIKPYLAYSDSLPDATGLASTPPAPKPVLMTDELQMQLPALMDTHALSAEDIAVITELVAQDPRPAYRQGEVGTRFMMAYAGWDVGFFMNAAGGLVIDVLRPESRPAQ